MRSSHSLDRVETAFDDERLVADAGLVLPATLAHLGLRQLVETYLDLGVAAGRANAGDKLSTLVMSALAGGDTIDDANALRTGGTARILGFSLKAASTLGTFLRSFRWGHVRQLELVTRHLLARAWAAGADPGAEPLTIDLDSTIYETYGLAKEGATRFTHTGVRGYTTRCSRSPRAPVTCSWPACEPATRTRCAAPLTSCARRSAGSAMPARAVRSRSAPTGASTVGSRPRLPDDGCPLFRHDPCQHRSLRGVIEAIPDEAWTPISYWLAGGADVAETTHTPFAHKSDARPVRLIVRRVRPTPGSQLALFTLYAYHAFITDRAGDTLALEADHFRTGSGPRSPGLPDR